MYTAAEFSIRLNALPNYAQVGFEELAGHFIVQNSRKLTHNQKRMYLVFVICIHYGYTEVHPINYFYGSLLT